MNKPTDTESLDWLERNLLTVTHARASCSVYMDGKHVRCQMQNEASGSGAGPSNVSIRARSIRDAVTEAMNWKPEES